MRGFPGNIGNMMKQAQEFQKKLEQAQEEAGKLEVTGTSGGSMVSVIATCKGDVRSVKIAPSLVDPAEVDVLEDLIVAAVNDAHKKAEDRMQEEMGKITKGLQLPPGLKLPF